MDSLVAFEKRFACPRCPDVEMTPRTVREVRIDQCDRCHGTWYDDGELKTMLGRSYDYEQLMRNMDLGSSSVVCPHCQKRMTALSSQTGALEFTIDHCMDCRGFWLDYGELEKMESLARQLRLRKPGPMRATPMAGGGFTRATTTVSVSAGQTQSSEESAFDYYRSMDLERAAAFESISPGVYLFCLFSQLPVEVFNPRRRFPWFLSILIAANFAIFMAMSSASPGIVHDFMRTFGAVPRDLLLHGFIWQAVTYAFLHASWGHVIGNMYMLWTFGDNVEDVMQDHGVPKGTIMFVAFYILCSVAAAFGHCLLMLGSSDWSQMGTIPLVGASGGVSGILAAYWRLFPNSRLYQVIFFFPLKIPVWIYFFIWVLWNVMIGMSAGMGSSVSWSGHLAGFAAGWFILPRFLPFAVEDFRREKYLLG